MTDTRDWEENSLREPVGRVTRQPGRQNSLRMGQSRALAQKEVTEQVSVRLREMGPDPVPQRSLGGCWPLLYVY